VPQMVTTEARVDGDAVSGVSSYRWSDEGLEGERLSGDVAVTDGVVATAGGAERAPGDGVYKPGVPVDVVVESVGAGACAAGGSRRSSRRPKMGATVASVSSAGSGACEDAEGHGRR
jgi:hypothetical protein